MTESELLFTEILQCGYLDLYRDSNKPLDKTTTSLVASVLKKRMTGEPIQYILGRTEFMGLEFKVTPDVFIPRPETEILVETTIDIVKLLNCQTVKLLDIGTGSGCIAVSLAKYLPSAKVVATDISLSALRIAKDNAIFNNVADRINFLKSDLFTPLEIPKYTRKKIRFLTGFTSYELLVTSYDIIVANPPYIPAVEIESLQPEVQYEPRIALDGGEDGLDFYCRIIRGIDKFLKKDGFLVMEMGYGQCGPVKEIFKLSGKFEIIEVVKDYNSIDRVIIARKI